MFGHNETTARAILEQRIAYYREALMEISKGRGPYSKDPHTHATNCVNAMKEIALRALNEEPIEYD